MQAIGSLEDVGVFVRVVESGSFSEAAREIGISKSAVSKAVARLEGRLGVHLLHRTTRSMSVTRAGGHFFDRCARVVHELERAQRALREDDRSPTGTLRVAVPGTLERLRLAPLVPRFLRRYPDCRLHFVPRADARELAEGAVDLAIQLGGGPIEPGFHALPLALDGVSLCAAPSYLRGVGELRHPDDLIDCTCISYRELFPDEVWRLRDAEGRGLRVPASGLLSSESGEAVRSAVLAGCGLSLLPHFLVGEDLRSGRLRPVLSTYAEDTCPIYAVCRRSDELSAKVRAFVELVAAELAGDGEPGAVDAELRSHGAEGLGAADSEARASSQRGSRRERAG